MKALNLKKPGPEVLVCHQVNYCSDPPLRSVGAQYMKLERTVTVEDELEQSTYCHWPGRVRKSSCNVVTIIRVTIANVVRIRGNCCHTVLHKQYTTSSANRGPINLD